MSTANTTIQRINSTSWMLRARELEAELAEAHVEIAKAKAEAARERLMRSRLTAEVEARETTTNHHDRTEPKAA